MTFRCPYVYTTVYCDRRESDSDSTAPCDSCAVLFPEDAKDDDSKNEVVIGNIVIKKGMTNFGEDAITITNKDGKDESIMLFEDDWDCLLIAIDNMKNKIKDWRHKE